MSRRKWIKTRYFTEVHVTQVCPFCKHFFKYVRTSKPRKYCEPEQPSRPHAGAQRWVSQAG